MEKWTDEQIRELCERATEGTWEVEKRYHEESYEEFIKDAAVVVKSEDGGSTITRIETDLAFIAAARELVPSLLARARKAESEVRKLTKDMQELLAERNDLKAMLADARVRNEVQKRWIRALIKVLVEEIRACPAEYVYEADQCAGQGYAVCKDCWHDWLEQEVRA